MSRDENIHTYHYRAPYHYRAESTNLGVSSSRTNTLNFYSLARSYHTGVLFKE